MIARMEAHRPEVVLGQVFWPWNVIEGVWVPSDALRLLPCYWLGFECRNELLEDLVQKSVITWLCSALQDSRISSLRRFSDLQSSENSVIA